MKLSQYPFQGISASSSERGSFLYIRVRFIVVAAKRRVARAFQLPKIRQRRCAVIGGMQHILVIVGRSATASPMLRMSDVQSIDLIDWFALRFELEIGAFSFDLECELNSNKMELNRCPRYTYDALSRSGKLAQLQELRNSQVTPPSVAPITGELVITRVQSGIREGSAWERTTHECMHNSWSWRWLCLGANSAHKDLLFACW